MPSRLVTVTRKRRVSTITLKNPDSQNLLDTFMCAEFENACNSLANSTSRVIIITGDGDAFASGMEPPPKQVYQPSAASAVASLFIPTIAWIDGSCLDMGLELALACDIRVASSSATFGIRHVRHGKIPWDGGTQRLARLVGRGHAMRLLLTGDVIDAPEALRIGLIEFIDSRDRVYELAESISNGAPLAARYSKEAVFEGLNLTLAQGLRFEGDLSVLLQSTSDRAEGVQSFLDRRKPAFRGD